MDTLAILLMIMLPELKGELTVCVRDFLGGVPAATVSVLNPPDLSEIAVETTRRDGCATIEGLTLRQEYLVRAQMVGFLVSESTFVADDQSSRIELELIEPKSLSLVRILADPVPWGGKYVKVTGFLIAEDSRGYLYPTREYWKSGDIMTRLELVVRSTSGVKLKRHDRSYVSVAGRFELPNPKTVVVTGGVLVDVSSVTRSRR